MIGREAIMRSLECIGVGPDSARSIASSLVLIQLDPELSFWQASTTENVQEFVSDCQMIGAFGLDMFESIERLLQHLRTLADFYGPDDGRTRKIECGVHSLARAAYGCI